MSDDEKVQRLTKCIWRITYVLISFNIIKLYIDFTH